MSISSFNDIWMLMREYTFVVDPDSINEDLSCCICNKLLIDACHGVCGCRYCYSCINDYLTDGDKYCPGGKTECNEEYLVMERDVTGNQRINKKISNLRVLCPNESCQSKIELTQMREHLRVCTKQSMECPYITIGCHNMEETKDTILTHLRREELTHIELLIECVNNLRNEVNGLKNNFEASKLEIATLKEESRMKEREMNEIRTEVRDQRREIECLKEECVNKENRMTTLEEELREVRNEMGIRIEGEMAVERGEIERVMNDARMERENVAVELRGSNEEIKEMKVELGTANDARERRMNNMIKLRPNIDAHFIWTIGGIKEKAESKDRTEIFSKSFYADNYKLCLSLRIGSGDYIYVWFYIMRGDNDDRVKWPMRGAVTVGIVDQYTLHTHSSRTYKYDTHPGKAFSRPINDRNQHSILVYCRKYSSIKDSPSITADDRIVVSCTVTDP